MGAGASGEQSKKEMSFEREGGRQADGDDKDDDDEDGDGRCVRLGGEGEGMK